MLTLTITGTSPLVVHRFGSKARREIETKQQKLAKLPKGARDPDAEYKDAMYLFKDGSHGFPAGGIAAALETASVDVFPKKKSMIRRNLWVEDDGTDTIDGWGLVKISGKPCMRSDVVRLAGPSRPADMRYRPEYNPWSMVIRVRFDARMLEPDQVMQLAIVAGESIGLGEGRPEKTITMGWGKFMVSKASLTEAATP